MPEQLVSNPGGAYQTITDFTTGYDADGLVPIAFAGSIRAEYEAALTSTSDNIVTTQVTNFVAVAAGHGLRVAHTLHTFSTPAALAGIATKNSSYTVASGTQLVRSEVCVFGPVLALFAAGITPTFGTVYTRDGTTDFALGTASTTGLNLATGLGPNTGATTAGLAWVWVEKS